VTIASPAASPRATGARPSAEAPGQGATGPEGSTFEITFDDSTFSGGFRERAGPNQGRAILYLFGSGTGFAVLTATFEIRVQPRGDARLAIVGLDSAGPDRTAIEVFLNKESVFRGRSPFRSADPRQTAASWTEHEWRVRSGTLRRGENVLTIRNLERSAAIGAPPYVVLDVARLTYRT
jgi:hypothetical protein